MSLPTLERSYDFETNWLYTETGDGNLDRRYCSLKVYNTLLGYAHNPWTLVASSNGSTAGWPGPGWSGIGDVIYGTPRSWFVMENVHGVQILWSLTSGNDVGTWISPDGSLSGGSPSAEPTGYAIQTENDNAFFSGSETVRLNFWHAQDGTFDFFTCMRTDNGINTWSPVLAAKVFDAPTEWGLPWLQAVHQAYTGPYPAQASAYNLDWCSAGTLWKGYKGAGGDTPIEGKLSTQMCNDQIPKTMFTAPSEITGKWQMFPMMFLSTTLGSRGIMGRLPDFYATSATLLTGDSIEEDPTTPAWLWAVQGEFVFPWNGTQMLTTV